MLEFSSYLHNNVTNVKYSPIFYIKTKKNNTLKLNSSIKGFYKDEILKDFIYISSSNFLKNSFVKKEQLQNIDIDKKTLNFLSMTNHINFDKSIFNLNPYAYYINLVNKYFIKKYLILSFLSKNPLKENKLKSFSYNVYKKYISKKKQVDSFKYNRLTLLDGRWRSLFFF